MLIEHRVDDVDKGLIAGEEAMPAGQEIPLQLPLALVFAQHLHHSPVRRQMIVVWQAIGHLCAVGDVQDILPAV
jgi:hypothetical protein